ncbi:hypothetical protein BH23VER1_BH23VER1_25000 [soil metagenome]
MLDSATQRRLADQRILVIGDLILDRFVWGGVSRISPEAPVPVVEVQRETVYPGGAANVARNLVPFTRHVSIIGRIGSDLAGGLLRDTLDRDGIGITDLIVSPTLPTTAKERIFARNQQVVRVDREVVRGLEPSEKAEILSVLDGRLGDFDAIILQDYGKGFLDQELVDAIASRARRASVLTIADPKPSNPLAWGGINVVKPNRAELLELAGVPRSAPSPDPLEDRAVLTACEILRERWQNDHLLVTLSEQGMLLVPRHGEIVHVPAEAREVFDVSGAGDTALALFALALAAGASPADAAALANRASSIVVGKLGTATVEPSEVFAATASPEPVLRQ